MPEAGVVGLPCCMIRRLPWFGLLAAQDRAKPDVNLAPSGELHHVRTSSRNAGGHSMEPTDTELMLRVRNDDVAAFRELLRRYREPLRRFFAALLADRSQVDDFVQETFMRLWLHRRRYEPTGKFSA